MLRKDITNGFQQVLDAIQECHILNLLESVAIGRSRSESDKKKNDVINSVQKLRKWACASEKFNDASRTLMKMLNISFLDDPDSRIWQLILSPEEGAKLQAEAFFSIKFYVEEVPKMIQLLEQDVDHYSPKEAEIEARERAVLSTLVIEEKAFSTPARITMLMTSVQLLYEVYAEIDNVSPTELCVISCDSGSDKSVDFLGAAKIIEQIRKTILDLWDRIVFYRERKLDAGLDLVSKSLPIIEHIDSLEKNGKLGPEQAGKMRRDISEGVGKFIDSGAVIPEMEERSTVSPRQLMAPEPKLLVSDTQDQASEKEFKDKQKTKGNDKEHEQTKSSILEDPELKVQLEKVVKEALEKERAAEDSKDGSEEKDSEKTEDDTQPTDTSDKNGL